VGEADVGGAVIAAVAGPLEGAELGETGLPITQDMLRHAKLIGKLADGAKSLVGLARRVGHGLSRGP
jgi:pyocin large subunit-like protein